MRRLFALALVVASLPACMPSVGRRDSAACDDELARTVVYTRAGRPAYVGQALLIQSCGGLSGACHSPVALDRYGVPAGLDFTALPVTTESDADLLRLATVQATIHRYRNLIWRDVLDGSMPPGDVGHEVLPGPDQGYAYWVLGDTPEPADPIPGLETPEGREALRNWLACGSPVVERYTPLMHEPTCETDADCPVSGECDAPWCAPIGDVVPALDVRFADVSFSTLYYDILRPACATGNACHGRNPSADFDLSTLEIARLEVEDGAAPNSAATGAVCEETGYARVEHGNPDRSLLFRKLSAMSPCGQPMPYTTGGGGVELTANEVDAIRLWILCSVDPPPDECCTAFDADPACCTDSPPTDCPVPVE